MAVHDNTRRPAGFRLLPSRHGSRRAAAATPRATATATTTAATTAARTLAGLRILTGFVFLWAFLDKTFGWEYATPAGGGWVDGGSPTEGFLSHVSVGPLEDTFHGWAGDAWADWTFMLGLLAIGLALLGGVALRLAAAGGTVMMGLMWAAEWPLDQTLADGSLSMSTNPLIDYHVIYAAALIALAAAHAGATWGLAGRWERLPVVRDAPWLR
ncbi:DoxX family membrane protein [Streptomyces klenkii]|uniref:DoxX family membrane protein n=1 Tax=Streptomyces klenkii TaxID=1420899 RepID=A0A3B0A817_9ACTN|nr:DoxX family membrane protein [Streptomyces klenkii]RKN56413.1 DoxX family membrane protein [Streptomyces klenkii]